MHRRWKARDLARNKFRAALERTYDEEKGGYTYLNRITGTARFGPPRIFENEPFEPKEGWAIRLIQGGIRSRNARRKALAMLDGIWLKEYDNTSDQWYYTNKLSGRTSWTKPFLYGSHEPPVNEMDAIVLGKDVEIEKLKKQLEKKEKEARDAKRLLEARIQAERVKLGELDVDSVAHRSKHMDEWSIEAVMNWFEEIGFKEYRDALKEHKVDGILLLHLLGEDWVHLGIRSPLHVRRIDVAMQKYRLRFQNRQAGGDDEDDDYSDVSASDTPSELLDEEELYGPDGSDDEQNEELGEGELDKDELLERKLDEENITKEILFEGDGDERPLVGDVAKIHFTCTTLDGHVVESSRKVRKRAFEFVVGAGQVVKGLDRGITTMSFGERAKFTVTPEYGYGERGFPPNIPPSSALVFDVNLIRFWERPRWYKHLLQVTGPYDEKPYAKKQRDIAGEGEGDGGLAAAGGAPADVPYGKVKGRGG
ncbi:unnamed protein product [Chrysoparadoxa australica]